MKQHMQALPEGKIGVRSSLSSPSSITSSVHSMSFEAAKLVSPLLSTRASLFLFSSESGNIAFSCVRAFSKLDSEHFKSISC